MSAAVPPIPAEAATPRLSQVQRLANIFTFSPSQTFADIRQNQSWWVPWLITGIFATVTIAMFNGKVDLDRFIREQIANSPMQSQAFETLTKAQQDQRIAISIKITRFTAYMVPVLSLVFGLLIAAILMVAFNFIHEANVSYKKSLAIWFYAGLPSLISAILAIVTLAMASDMEGRNPRNLVATNPAYFMDYQNTSKFLYGMAGSLDVITIWVIVLVGIGFRLNSTSRRLTTGTAVATVAVLYLIWKLVASALGFV